MIRWGLLSKMIRVLKTVCKEFLISVTNDEKPSTINTRSNRFHSCQRHKLPPLSVLDIKLSDLNVPRA